MSWSQAVADLVAKVNARSRSEADVYHVCASLSRCGTRIIVLSDEFDPREFQARLAETMAALNLRQVDVAMALGVKQQTVSKWLAGETVPRAQTMFALLRMLDPTGRVGPSGLVQPAGAPENLSARTEDQASVLQTVLTTEGVKVPSAARDESVLNAEGLVRSNEGMMATVWKRTDESFTYLTWHEVSPGDCAGIAWRQLVPGLFHIVWVDAPQDKGALLMSNSATASQISELEYRVERLLGVAALDVLREDEARHLVAPLSRDASNRENEGWKTFLLAFASSDFAFKQSAASDPSILLGRAAVKAMLDVQTADLLAVIRELDREWPEVQPQGVWRRAVYILLVLLGDDDDEADHLRALKQYIERHLLSSDRLSTHVPHRLHAVAGIVTPNSSSLEDLDRALASQEDRQVC